MNKKLKLKCIKTNKLLLLCENDYLCKDTTIKYLSKLQQITYKIFVTILNEIIVL